MSYPEDISASGICMMEGCDYREGGACIRCGSRLRCGCGQFLRVDRIDEHNKTCRWLAEQEQWDRREMESRMG